MSVTPSEPRPAPTPPAGDGKEERLSLEALREKLDAPEGGLGSTEAVARLERYGPNEIAEETSHPLLKLLSYLWGPIPWMIEIAAVLSMVVSHWTDFGIITALLVVNALVGFWEEYQAGNTIAALKSKLAVRARVRRDGAWSEIPARELVPGDLVRVRLGDVAPADMRILSDDPVQVDQSALTGESLPVTAERGDPVYSGSVLRQGEADALVHATGRDTFFGRTALLVKEARTVSHFQRAVLGVGNYLIAIALALILVILVVAILRHDALMTTIQFALVLMVAAIPVAMPTVLSVTMAVGARLLAAKQAIVARLASIEELAGIDVLCSDKTGTLTQNRLKAGEPHPAGSTDRRDLLLWAALASRSENADPIDLAVLDAVEDPAALDGYEVTRFVPFDPVHKRTEAAVTDPDGGSFRVTKGAPQVILDLSADAGEVRADAEAAVEDFAARGFRALGVARADGDEDFRFAGILPLSDPPREDSRATIDAARELGVRVKMVTGDQVAIGREVARELGMGTNLMNADVFEEAGEEEDARLAAEIEAADGFAQVYPEHKYRIVSVLQDHDHIVGMTGDGVNDAPALKKADVGIAVSGATDAARSAAAIVLLSPGLSVIVDALRESRRIFKRMTSYAIYRITETIRVLLFMTLSILVFNFYPVTAVMIVLLALLNDGAILSIAYDRVRGSRRPDAWNMRDVLSVSTVLGTLGVVSSFGLFFAAQRLFRLDEDVIRTLMYLKLSVAGHMTIFVTRTRKPFWSIAPARVLLLAVLGTQTVATLIAVYGIFMSPIGWTLALAVWGYALVWFVIADRVKLLAYRVIDRLRAAPTAAGSAA